MPVIDIARGVCAVAGPGITNPDDSSAYLVDFYGAAALIDSGCDERAGGLISNIEKILAVSGSKLETIILTHNHIDHTGGAAAVAARFGAKTIMHALDAPAVEKADLRALAADWYGVFPAPLAIDIKFDSDDYLLTIGDSALRLLHTPGHTPGSIAALLERDSLRILFGQDIHGPFMKQFNSDKALWRESMARLLGLECDILCEGHYGVIEPAPAVKAFIERHLRAN